MLDTGLDAVRLVAAAPSRAVLVDGRLPESKARTVVPLRVAAEMPQVSPSKWIERACPSARLVRTFGATEVFPPEDADCIVDIAATGATLRANGLEVVDEVMRSSTRLYASHVAMADRAQSAGRIEGLVAILQGVLEGRRRVDARSEHRDSDQLEALVEILPCMRRPTVAQPVRRKGLCGQGRRAARRRAGPVAANQGRSAAPTSSFRR